MTKKVVSFGEIMLRLATPGYLRFSQATQYSAIFGGSEANVAVSLVNFGIRAEFVTHSIYGNVNLVTVEEVEN